MTLIDHVQQVHDLTHHAGDFLAAPPNPGGGEAPPNVGDKVLTLLKWTAYLASSACVGGLIYTAGRMAMSYKSGDTTNVSQLGWVLMACVIIGTASGIVGALIK
jgi:hypothetical protein